MGEKKKGKGNASLLTEMDLIGIRPTTLPPVYLLVSANNNKNSLFRYCRLQNSTYTSLRNRPTDRQTDRSRTI